MSEDKINRRLNLDKERPDLFSMINRDGEGVKGLSYSETVATSSLSTVAASNTYITVLSGMANYLVRNLDNQTLLVADVRKAFETEDEFILGALKNLPYLNAVIKEGPRMCNPT
jgi:cytochrome P450